VHTGRFRYHSTCGGCVADAAATIEAAITFSAWRQTDSRLHATRVSAIHDPCFRVVLTAVAVFCVKLIKIFPDAP
jgi:hypothetical protein